ncbi:MAG: isoprenylcysteine carboxylmethyltransferase family protein [Terracidiphilus sp.]
MRSASLKARVYATLGTAIFLFVAPGTVAGYIPWRMGKWQVHASFFGLAALRWMGALLMLAGIVLLVDAFARFALQGIGTPAPVFPTRHLVVSGSYCYVRNPMYVAVVSLILGQGLLFWNVRVVMYGLCVWLAMHLFVVIYEEPTMRKSFPAAYAVFSAHVPRWAPRLTPWKERT